jgi:hypothetical protein
VKFALLRVQLPLLEQKLRLLAVKFALLRVQLPLLEQKLRLLAVKFTLPRVKFVLLEMESPSLAVKFTLPRVKFVLLEMETPSRTWEFASRREGPSLLENPSCPLGDGFMGPLVECVSQRVNSARAAREIRLPCVIKGPQSAALVSLQEASPAPTFTHSRAARES